jgi:hypothetical protein
MVNIHPYLAGVRVLLTAVLLTVTTLASPQQTEMAPASEKPSGITGGSSHAGHGKPQLATGAAFAPDGSLWVVLVEHGHLYLQRHGVDGAWDERRAVDIGGETVATNGDNRPKLAFGKQGQVVLSYTRPLARPYTGEIRMLRSDDGGATFSAPFTVHQDRQVITHRFESILFDARGDLYTFWIDKRDAERTWAANGGDQLSYQGAAIYYNVSKDGGLSFGDDTRLADYSCECCRIALVAEPEQGVSVLWRHVFTGSVRDHAFARVATPRPVTLQRASDDGWVLKACPHHGPGLARDATGAYHAVWFGEREARQRVRYGRLDKNGKPQGRTVELPDARADHADIVVTGKRVVIVWRSFDGQQTHLRAWLSKDGGRHFRLRELAASAFENDHPRLIAQGKRIAVVWRTEHAIHVEHLH